jgi:hypothetical protein
MATPRPNLVYGCPVECSYTVEKIGPEKVELLRVLAETGVGAVIYAREGAKILDGKFPETNAGRHIKHYKDPPDPADAASDSGPKVSDLAILDEIIAAGARNSKNWKPSIKDTLDAMKLKAQMTGNSAFEDMLALVDSAIDLGEEVPEDPAALGTVDEQPEPEPELPEPFIG